VCVWVWSSENKQPRHLLWVGRRGTDYETVSLLLLQPQNKYLASSLQQQAWLFLDFRLPSRCWCDLCSSGVLRGVVGCLPTFRDNVSCPETSVKNYHMTPRNTPVEHRSHQHCDGSLKPRLVHLCGEVTFLHIQRFERPFLLGLFTLEDGSDTLCRNVGKQSLRNAA
jgi:hypothetical protein